MRDSQTKDDLKVFFVSFKGLFKVLKPLKSADTLNKYLKYLILKEQIEGILK